MVAALSGGRPAAAVGAPHRHRAVRQRDGRRRSGCGDREPTAGDGVRVLPLVRRRGADRPFTRGEYPSAPSAQRILAAGSVAHREDWLDAAEAEGGHSYALACLLGINGLRIGEVCSTDVTDLSEDRWHHTLSIVGKGDRPTVIPLPPRTALALSVVAVAGRHRGPLLLTEARTRMNRAAAARTVVRLARAAGIGKHITPHLLRHSAITAA